MVHRYVGLSVKRPKAQVTEIRLFEIFRLPTLWIVFERTY